MVAMDLVYIGLLILGAFKGFKKGLILEVFSILALVLAVIGAFKLLDEGIIWLTRSFGKPHPFIPFLSFIMIFIAIILGVNVIGRLTKGLVNLAFLGWIDQVFGSVLGIVKWTFGISLVLWLMHSFLPDLSTRLSNESEIYPYLMPFCTKVFHFLKSLFPFLDDMVREIGQYLQ